MKITGIYPSARPSFHSHSHNENVGYRAPYFCLDIHDVHCYSCRSFLYFPSHFSAFFMPSSPVLFHVSPFFFPRIHRPCLPSPSSSGGFYGHEIHPDKRHVSEPVMKTSLTRRDSGGGSCRSMYIVITHDISMKSKSSLTGRNRPLSGFQ